MSVVAGVAPVEFPWENAGMETAVARATAQVLRRMERMFWVFLVGGLRHGLYRPLVAEAASVPASRKKRARTRQARYYLPSPSAMQVSGVARSESAMRKVGPSTLRRHRPLRRATLGVEATVPCECSTLRGRDAGHELGKALSRFAVC